jgi:hypothetical protein
MIEAAPVRSMRSSTRAHGRTGRLTPARIRTKSWAADGRRSSRRFHADRSICSLDADLLRTIHGFDALLVLTGSTASANL